MPFSTKIEADTRVKTDMRLTPAIVRATEDLVRAIGVPKNAIFTISVIHLWLMFSSLVPRSRRRLELLEELEKQLTVLFEAAKKSA